MITLICSPPRGGKTVLAALMAHASGGEAEVVFGDGLRTARALETLRVEHQNMPIEHPVGAIIVDTFSDWLTRKGGSILSVRDVMDGIDELARIANGRNMFLTARSFSFNEIPRGHPMLFGLCDNIISISPRENTERNCLVVKCRDKQTPFSFSFDVHFVTDDEGRKRPYAVMDTF